MGIEIRGTRRLAAVAAIAGSLAMLVVVVVMLVSSLLWALLVVVAIGAIVTAAVRVVVLEGRHRQRWAAVCIVAVVALLVGVIMIAIDRPGGAVLLALLGLVSGALAVYAQRGYLRPTAAPHVTGPVHDVHRRRAVLFLNPKSGSGKVGQFDLVAEAQARGVETVVLGPDDDLTALAEAAVADGAEVLGMAGGDGSQADVAAVAVAHDLPFVCIPAGTRNHFALDLNLDRADPRLALDAFVEGVERRVDHGMAGDRFFVNNVSLGIYPHVVDDPQYREGRMRAAGTIIPELMNPETPALSLRFDSPTGTHYETAQVLLVSNNPYRGFAAIDGAGRRISLEGGVLGVLVLAAADPDELARAARRTTMGLPLERVEGVDQWTATSIRVDSDDATVLAGIDGEALEMATPLDIRIVPGGLRVIVPVGTPETPAPTPSLLSLEAITNLVSIAGGVPPAPSDEPT
ncbi:MAG: diacylglycerol/lipid kinase family protein [Acidimicrobiales bacterium]